MAIENKNGADDQEVKSTTVNTDAGQVPTPTNVVLTEEEELLAMLQGDDTLSAEDKAAIAEFDNDEENEDLAFDASDENDSIGGNMPPLRPTVKKAGNKVIAVTLPLCRLVSVNLRTNDKADKSGYFVELKRTKLRFEFANLKRSIKDPNERHYMDIEAIASDLKASTRLLLHNKNLGRIKELAMVFNCVEKLRPVDQRSKLMTIKERNARKAEGNPMDQREFDLARYANTFKLWAIIFNNSQMINGVASPVYIRPDAKPDAMDKNGNPLNTLPLRIHLTVYKGEYTVAWPPFLERYDKEVRSGLVPDLNKNHYEITSDDSSNVNFSSDSAAKIVDADELEIEEIEFED